ncbi:MAG: hypothetical protein M3P06_04655 [Acidobacteriota bacterium]|nr:hypothetical protein [Acidobacteriota bacterium]
MNLRTLTTAAVLLLASSGGAAPAVSMQYTPVSCIKAGELPLLQLNIEGEGELRSYFRRINSTDWCSVEGLNDGPLSRVVLPKFDNGDEIEYFFVLLQGRRVVARSPRIYRARILEDCQMPFARHVLKLSLSCGEEVQAIPAALGAGYSVSLREPCEPSPFNPDDPCLDGRPPEQ